MLDEAGLKQVTIFASSSLDEYQIQDLVHTGAPIDAFGVGTKLAVMEDASYLDMAYKLVEYGGKGRLKLSSKKVLYPGRKQVFRQVDAGHMTQDVIGRFDEDLPGERLLQPVMKEGRIISRVDLEESRRRFQSELQRLPDPLRKLEPSPVAYPVRFSGRLQEDLDRIRKELAGGT
jgi:nicotinate phosphoribosyltransferase